MSKVILEGKCPRCHQGDMFQYPLAKLHKFSDMNEKCAHCDFRFEVEPGFFFGAMYISYAVSVAIFIAVSIGLNVLVEEPSLWMYLAGISIVAITLLPFTFRYSRIIFLHWFGGVKYDASFAK
ncbi:DUF983 domain-containing protein [Persicobacter psychrovividus]|uniref:DUF983 domain-containing protein n=1 Tax=Persicobacter psychrovividus TaxID=387638 RepID=A0ABN6LJZ2_9BACT|nr:hypothetical protein PEPS_40470 [Persicobacter psychrovividus]